jgi:site-specific DNA-methyltransferase (adenine-specific)
LILTVSKHRKSSGQNPKAAYNQPAPPPTRTTVSTADGVTATPISQSAWTLRDDGTIDQQPSTNNPQLVFHDPDRKLFVYNGNSLEFLDVIAAKYPEGRFDMIFADPPYFLSNGGITCHAGRMVKVDKGDWDKSRGPDLNHEFNLSWLERCQRVLKPNGTIWVSGTHHVIFSIGFAMQQLGFKILNDIAWEKPNPPPNLSCRYFTHSTETIIWASKSAKSKHAFNYKLMRHVNGGKQMKTVWRFAAPSSAENLWQTPDTKTGGVGGALHRSRDERRRLGARPISWCRHDGRCGHSSEPKFHRYRARPSTRHARCSPRRPEVNADVFVLIVGGRYGSEASNGDKKPSKTFFDRYDSITKKEYQSAVSRDIPVYVLIEANVYSEYHTYLRNKDTDRINYAHVDSINIFKLIEEILGQPRNNPVRTFEKFSEIESWLTEQWAGLFRELLQRQSEQQQLTELSSQVAELRAINETLKNYMEALMRGIQPNDSTKLIKAEERRLKEVEVVERLKTSRFASHAHRNYKVSYEDIVDAMHHAHSFSEFAKRFGDKVGDPDVEADCLRILTQFDNARRDFNKVRDLLGLKHFRHRRPEEDGEEPPAKKKSAVITKTV